MHDNHEARPQGDEAILPDDLLAARDRVARGRARAARAIGRGRARRRYLAPSLAVSAALLTLGAADRFVQSAVPTSGSTASALTKGSTTTGTQSLSQLSRVLAADQRAIDALALAQARLASNAESDGGGSSTGAAIQLPALPSIGSVPAISVPAAPVVSATTGASVVVP